MDAVGSFCFKILMHEESKGLTMFDPILLPLDGSPLAECALPRRPPSYLLRFVNHEPVMDLTSQRCAAISSIKNVVNYACSQPSPFLPHTTKRQPQDPLSAYINPSFLGYR